MNIQPFHIPILSSGIKDISKPHCIFKFILIKRLKITVPAQTTVRNNLIKHKAGDCREHYGKILFKTRPGNRTRQYSPGFTPRLCLLSPRPSTV
jgi:hypothetical protein